MVVINKKASLEVPQGIFNPSNMLLNETAYTQNHLIQRTITSQSPIPHYESCMSSNFNWLTGTKMHYQDQIDHPNNIAKEIY